MAKKAVVIGFSFLVQDPPSVQTIRELLKADYQVYVIQGTAKGDRHPFAHENLKLFYYDQLFFNLPFKKGRFYILLKSLSFVLFTSFFLLFVKSNVIVSIMLHPIAIIRGFKSLKVACIYDIPPIEFAGKISKLFFSLALKNLKNWQFVWASDKYKGEIIKQMACLKDDPIVCHNCPPVDYFEGINRSDSRKWLEKRLNEKNIPVSDETKIILRAGAVGKYGGIEETIEILEHSTDDLIFLLMGRPNDEYYNDFMKLVSTKKMNKKVYVWNLPTDEEWKKILIASDLGHLIHLKPEDDELNAAVFEQNSSMSNNRLFQYMAAGIPILAYEDERMSALYAEVDCFLVVDPNNLHASLESKLNFYLANRDRMRSKGEQGKAAFQKKYNWNFQFSEILKSIKK